MKIEVRSYWIYEAFCIMNYIELINNFWAYTEGKDISSSDTSLYFALLKYNNALNWIETFRCDYAVACQYARISKNTFYRSLDNLQDIGLIKYQKGQRNGLKPKITILKKKNKKGTIKEQKGNNEGTQKEQNEEQKGNLYKLINNKPINLKTYKQSLMSEIKISDVDENEIEYFQIAKAFQELFIKNLKEKNTPCRIQERATYKNYVNPIRLMMKNDGVKTEQIQKVFDFLNSSRCENENFSWKSNILSTKKLREKFTQLLLKSQQNNNEKSGNEKIADIGKRAMESEIGKNFRVVP